MDEHFKLPPKLVHIFGSPLNNAQRIRNEYFIYLKLKLQLKMRFKVGFDLYILGLDINS